ncbi:DUF2867 domain-containing protein [Aeromicrobium sp. 9AM]|uniref:DUF2867 domain-containing protein n=1 Tax=Aeromicrobium sp. 9AM TaxID=2653126 RepID=UPI0012F08D77|nr:DUF2867 domain-containing protein [Aeromicrobium sp. 9AM]VXB09606.1 conserved hypothetical protein [Aeromicrobium sp. 9AM]
MVTNVHERLIPVPADLVGESLDRVGSADDRWWPSPAWPPMVLEAPLGIWVRGSHGPIRYQVTEHVPGRRVVFTFDEGVGLRGSHRFEVVPQGAGSCVVRHVVEGRTTGTMRLVWPLAMRWLHDAVVEDLMDRVETDAGHPPARRARWSWWVRQIRRMTQPRATGVPVPATPLLENALPHVDWADAFAVRRPVGSSGDPQVWADAVFHAPPLWVGALLAARESLVRLVGIERAGRGVFDPVAHTDDEVLLGIDQSHLGFRASVLCEPDRVVVSTVVRLHNRRGRAYSAIVRRVHPAVVRAMLRRAAARVPVAEAVPAR